MSNFAAFGIQIYDRKVEHSDIIEAKNWIKQTIPELDEKDIKLKIYDKRVYASYVDKQQS